MLNQLLDGINSIAWPIMVLREEAMTEYVCPNCRDVVVFKSDELPVKFHAFCFDCGEWVDFEKEE